MSVCMHSISPTEEKQNYAYEFRLQKSNFFLFLVEEDVGTMNTENKSNQNVVRGRPNRHRSEKKGTILEAAFTCCSTPRGEAVMQETSKSQQTQGSSAEHHPTRATAHSAATTAAALDQRAAILRSRIYYSKPGETRIVTVIPWETLRFPAPSTCSAARLRAK